MSLLQFGHQIGLKSNNIWLRKVTNYLKVIKKCKVKNNIAPSNQAFHF